MTFAELPQEHQAAAKQLILDYMNLCEEEATRSNGLKPQYYTETDAEFLEFLALENFAIEIDPITKRKYITH